MKPHQIRGRLLLKGLTTALLAKDLDVSVVAVNRVIAGTLASRRIMRRIADLIGQRPERVFPAAARLFVPEHIRPKASRSTLAAAGVSDARRSGPTPDRAESQAESSAMTAGGRP